MSLWLPNTMNYAAYRVDRAVHEYDERLMFARNENTGDWCVYIRMPAGEPPYPVVGFGADVPSVEDVMFRIRGADTMRHGWKIFNEIQKSQEDYKKQFRDAADDASEESAEVVEHFLRKHGKSPIIKEFISKDIPKGGEASDAG